MVRYRRWCGECGRATGHEREPTIGLPWRWILFAPIAWLVDWWTNPPACREGLRRLDRGRGDDGR